MSVSEGEGGGGDKGKKPRGGRSIDFVLQVYIHVHTRDLYTRIPRYCTVDHGSNAVTMPTLLSSTVSTPPIPLVRGSTN